MGLGRSVRAGGGPLGPRASRDPACDRPRARRGGRPRHRHARGAEVRPGLRALRLRQSRCPEGGRAPPCRDRDLRQPESVHHQGRAGRRAAPRVRDPHAAGVGRAVLALWPHCRIDRGAGRPFVGHVRAATRGALPRRKPDHGGRRRLLVGDPEGAGAPQPPALLPAGAQGRAPGCAHRALRLRHRVAGPRAAAPHGAHADPLEVVLRIGHVRGDDPRAADGERALSDRERRAGAKPRLPPG